MEYCQETFNIPGLIQVVDGINGEASSRTCMLHVLTQRRVSDAG